jgi:hypothetical protein
MFIVACFICIYTAANAGSTEASKILIIKLIPRDIPVNCFGVEIRMKFVAPTLVKDNPVARIARIAYR